MLQVEHFDEIKGSIEANGNVVMVKMEQLRGLVGAGRTGVWVKQRIKSELESRGLATISELPDYQHEEVAVYKRGTPMAEVIDAVQKPSDDRLVRLREAASNEYAQTIQRIRELVCP